VAAATGEEESGPVVHAPAERVVDGADVPQGPEFLRARVRITELHDDKPVTSREEVLYKHGTRTRVEWAGGTDGRFADYAFYDYTTATIYRPLADDAILFSYRIVARERVLAQISGYLNTPAGEKLWRMVVNPDVSFDGHPCDLVLTGFATAGGVRALHWVWEARDLNGHPVRVVFPTGDGGIQIFEYLEASAEAFDPARVTGSGDMPVMSGF